jgi:hypothetical protein
MAIDDVLRDERIALSRRKLRTDSECEGLDAFERRRDYLIGLGVDFH